MQKVPILFKKVPILLVKVRLLFFPLRALNKIKLILNKATKKPQIKWLVIVRRRVNVVRLELNLVVAKWCGAVSICVTIDADDGDTFTYILENNSMAYFAVDGNMLKL
jgi:hypothetical protein